MRSKTRESNDDNGCDGALGWKDSVDNPMPTLEVDNSSDGEGVGDEKELEPCHVDHDILFKMWTKDYIGLYSQYAAVGLMTGSLGMTQNLCVYYYSGSSNLCANANNIIQMAWSFKVFYAIITDSYRPFGMRRKPYMIVGWALVLIMLLILALVADQLTDSAWVSMMMACHCFLMISDVPADGYCVELGQMESPEERGMHANDSLSSEFVMRVYYECHHSLIKYFYMSSRSNISH